MIIYSERKKPHQPKPHTTLKISYSFYQWVQWELTPVASSYSQFFRLSPFPELSPLLYPLLISKLFLEKMFLWLIQATALFFLCPSFWGDNGNYAGMNFDFIHSYQQDTDQISDPDLAHSFWWNRPVSVSFTQSVCIRSTSNEITLQIGQWVFLFPENSQSSPQLLSTQWAPHSRHSALPGSLWSCQVLSPPSWNCEKQKPGQKRLSQEICMDPDIKMRPPKPPKDPICKVFSSLSWQRSSVKGTCLVLLKVSWHT